VIASPKVYADVVDALADQARDTKTGMPDDEDALLGPVNNAGQLERVSGFFDRLPDHATISAGGRIYRTTKEQACKASRISGKSA